MLKALDQPAEREKATSSRLRRKSAVSRWCSGFRAASAVRRERGRQEPACLHRASIAPDLAVRSVPVIDPTAFLEASFTQSEDAPLLPGRVAIYRDGVFIRSQSHGCPRKDETVRLGFGADDKVKGRTFRRQTQRRIGRA